MTIKTTRIDDLTGREILCANYVEIAITLRQIGPTGAGPQKSRLFHTENARIMAMTDKAASESDVSSTCIELIRRLIAEEFDRAQTKPR